MLERWARTPRGKDCSVLPSAWRRLCSSSPAAIETDVREIVNGALFSVKYDEMVIVKDIEFFSMCEHHMLPFFGKMHVAYLPKNKVIGLSKLPRIVDAFARRLQIQERLTQQVAQTIQEADRAGGRGRHLRSAPLLHDDARRGEAALRRGDQRHARSVPRPQGDAGRVSVAGQLPAPRLLIAYRHRPRTSR